MIKVIFWILLLSIPQSYADESADITDQQIHDAQFIKRDYVVTDDALSIKGLTIGMSETQVIDLIPQLKDKIYPQKINTTGWQFGDSIGFLERSNVSCIASSPKEVSPSGPCDKISILESIPFVVIFAFVDKKLVNVEYYFQRKNGTRNSKLDNIYVDLKSAFSEKYKAQPTDVVVSGGVAKAAIAVAAVGGKEMSPVQPTFCGWVNESQNAAISIAGNFNDIISVVLHLRTSDYEYMLLKRKESISEFKSKLQSEAAEKELQRKEKELQRKKSDF